MAGSGAGATPIAGPILQLPSISPAETRLASTAQHKGNFIRKLSLLLSVSTLVHFAHAQTTPVDPTCDDNLTQPAEPWTPTNQPTNRWADSTAQPDPGPADLPGYMKGPLTKHGVVFGPNGKFQAAFNPASWTAPGTNGQNKVFLLLRGEEERPGAEWKRHSLPYLASSDDGLNFNLVKDDPVFTATEWYEEKGGIEDPRYFDMRLQPYVDPKDGKSFDGAILYVAYDGTTARVAKAFFNHANPTEFRKGGLLFDPEQVRANPLVPDRPEWNKSAGAIQYRDPKTGKIKNLIYIGEGNQAHGGIMAMTSDEPMAWQWPARTAPVLQSENNTYTERLIEVAYPPVLGPLGIYVQLHGDSRPRGYQVGYAVFSLNNPTGPPIYRSNSPFLWPQETYETHGQVDMVVFASGSVEFRGADGILRRIIYYGGADRVVGAASAESATRQSPIPRVSGNLK